MNTFNQELATQKAVAELAKQKANYESLKLKAMEQADQTDQDAKSLLDQLSAQLKAAQQSVDEMVRSNSEKAEEAQNKLRASFSEIADGFKRAQQKFLQ